ncbi:MAG: YqeG family HAD IIIA-type phosphatase [Ruminococcus flavefaciens]|nr:YqeG family HAD IIIA-type phosphatase [Ruminococcus flavefaciens]
MLFKSTEYFKKITDITPDFLKKNNIKGLVLDVDNTLTTHDNPKPAENVPEWIGLMKKNRIKLVIVSNNHPPRVKPFADMLGIDFVCDGKKPLPNGFREAVKRLGLPKKNISAVGDQIFTDVLGANLFGIRMLYTAPIEYEKTTFFKVKRFLEKPFLPKNFR